MPGFPAGKEGIGLGTEFRSEKIPRNRLRTVSVIPRKKALIPRYSEFRGRANSEVRNGTERNVIPRKKLVLRNSSKITWQNDLSVHQKSSFLPLLLKYSAFFEISNVVVIQVSLFVTANFISVLYYIILFANLNVVIVLHQFHLTMWMSLLHKLNVNILNWCTAYI